MYCYEYVFYPQAKFRKVGPVPRFIFIFMLYNCYTNIEFIWHHCDNSIIVETVKYVHPTVISEDFIGFWNPR